MNLSLDFVMLFTVPGKIPVAHGMFGSLINGVRTSSSFYSFVYCVILREHICELEFTKQL